MSSIETITPAPAHAGASLTVRGHALIELAETLKLAIPIALTQLGQIAMMTTDLALIGRLGEQAVAAAALAHTIFFIGFTLGMGLVSAVAPLAAQAFGARDPRIVRRALRVGLWTALFVALPLMAIPLFGERLLIWLGQAPASAKLAQQYLMGLGWCIVPALWFIAIRSFMGAVNRPEPGLWITLVAIPANGLLAYALIHGHFGLPQLGLFGAGLATSIVNVGMCAAGLWFCHARRPFKKYHVLGRFWRIDWSLMKQLLVIGVPISMSFLLEYGLFSAAALLMGLISTTAITAHQISLQIAAILFMVPFGIGMAATVRVGHAVGRGDVASTRRAGFVAIVLGALFMAAMTLAVIAVRYQIAFAFLGTGGDIMRTVDLVATLLMVGATFFVADGVQTVAAGALRGLNDTRIPMLMAAFSYWGLGFGVAYALAFTFGFGAIGVWIGLSCGTAAYAALLVGRFYLLTKRLQLQSDAPVTAPRLP